VSIEAVGEKEPPPEGKAFHTKEWKGVREGKLCAAAVFSVLKAIEQDSGAGAPAVLAAIDQGVTDKLESNDTPNHAHIIKSRDRTLHQMLTHFAAEVENTIRHYVSLFHSFSLCLPPTWLFLCPIWSWRNHSRVVHCVLSFFVLILIMLSLPCAASQPAERHQKGGTALVSELELAGRFPQRELICAFSDLLGDYIFPFSKRTINSSSDLWLKFKFCLWINA
jgi:hypothetical protein